VAAHPSTRHRYWRRVGSRAAAGKPEKTGVPGASSSPLHFSAGGDTNRHLHKKKKHKQRFGLDLLSSGFSLSLSLDSLIFLLQVTDPAVG